MPRGTTLTSEERAAILALKSCELSERAIAKKIGRSRPAVHAFLASPATYNTTKRPGRPPKLTPDAKARLVHEAGKGQSSARALQEQLQLPVGVRRVIKLLGDQAPGLQEAQGVARVGKEAQGEPSRRM
jgi:transposase